jgi:predicted CopG family antitoxin
VARRVRTIAVSEDTYRMLAAFKQRTGSATFEEAVRKAVELAKRALAAEALEHVRSKRLTEEEKQMLAELRAKLREEGAWLSTRVRDHPPHEGAPRPAGRTPLSRA